MFVLGHMGIGSKIAAPWSRGLPKRWLLLGTIVPDLIDKPLYYGLVAWTGRHGTEIGLVSGSRTFGHTGLLLLILALIAAKRESRALAALVLGMATHLLIDSFSDAFRPPGSPEFLYALLFPFLGFRFPGLPFDSIRDHLGTFFRPAIFWGEVVGALILSWDLWKDRHENDLLKRLRELRSNRTTRRRLRFPFRRPG